MLSHLHSTRSDTISFEELHTLLIAKESTITKNFAIENILIAMATFQPSQNRVDMEATLRHNHFGPITVSAHFTQPLISAQSILINVVLLDLHLHLDLVLGLEHFLGL